HQAGDPQHFCFPGGESDLIDEQLAGHAGVLDRDVACFEDNFTTLVCSFGKDLADFATDHFRDDSSFVKALGGVSANRAAVTQHRDAIADAEHFVELVR